MSSSNTTQTRGGGSKSWVTWRGVTWADVHDLWGILGSLAEIWSEFGGGLEGLTI